MTRVSKKQLKKEISSNIKLRFSQIVSDLKSPKEASLFLSDLLSDTEEVMLAKRLATIVMLKNNIPFSVIEKTLKISSATISRVSTVLDKNGYSNILKGKDKKRKGTKAKDSNIDFEVLFRMGMPPIVGRGRWKFLDEYLEKKSKK